MGGREADQAPALVSHQYRRGRVRVEACQAGSHVRDGGGIAQLIEQGRNLLGVVGVGGAQGGHARTVVLGDDAGPVVPRADDPQIVPFGEAKIVSPADDAEPR